MKLSPRKCVLTLAGFLALPLFGFIYLINKPRVLAVAEVPIAYWAWRTNAPESVDVENAFADTRAKTLFIRAGQIDVRSRKFKRIRPLEGRVPSLVELHLVYNATPELLLELESSDLDALTMAVAETYKADLVRFRNDSAQVLGLQLDLDFPNRLLPKYATLLRKLRPLLPLDTQLSITGLPAWMATSDLATVLESVDFWIPQCYGGEIPMHISRRVPISSASAVARTVDKARRLGKPFYAGLAAYSYTILYGKDGNLVELRGDIAPADVERSPDLEQIERRPFSTEEPSAMRYEYRVKNDGVVDGLVVRAGQTVLLDMPSSASLRASARAVRENGGVDLLGICFFRLPTSADQAVLTIAEIKPALADRNTKVSTGISLLKLDDGRLYVEINNNGSASSMLGDKAFVAEIDLPSGIHANLDRSEGFHAYDTLCRFDAIPAQPCSAKRANVLRLEARSWRANDGGFAVFTIEGPLPSELSIRTTFHVDDGRAHTETFEIPVDNNESGKTKE